MKLVMMKGLPASGKSTYARKLADSGYIRVNKDDLRDMLHNGKWSNKNERMIIRLRDLIIHSSLEDGQSVVVDDTNLHPKHHQRLAEIAKEHEAKFETKFFDVPVEECIKRDLARTRSVGEKVIRGMHNQFLRKTEVYVNDLTLPKAVIVDIDGTLALNENGRSPFAWDRVGEDTLNIPVLEVVDALDTLGYAIILMSGRDSVCRQQTKDWLNSCEINYDCLLMRAEGDNRKDSIIKRELFENQVRGQFDVKFVLDDRDQVVEMWRDMGLPCFQVAPGDF